MGRRPSISPPHYPVQHWPWHVHLHRFATFFLEHLFLAAFFVHFLAFHLSPHTTPGGSAGDGGQAADASRQHGEAAQQIHHAGGLAERGRLQGLGHADE